MPLLVTYKTTERLEPIALGVSKLIGTNTQKIYKEISQLLINEYLYREMPRPCFPYGDGHASYKIINTLKGE